MIRFYCKICGKEIFQQIMLKFAEFQNYTLWEAEEACFCEEHEIKREEK